MGSLNHVQIIGNLGRDPEVRYTQSNDMVVSFSVATSESWKDKNNEWQQVVEWHNISCWKFLAERAEKYLAKGKQVYIEGKLKTRKWQDKQGNDRYSTGIVASKLILLGKKDDDQGAAGNGFDPEPLPKGNPEDEEDLPF